MRGLNYDFLNCLKKMPPLSHSKNGEAFDITKSDTAKFITTQPDVMQKIFSMANNKKVIVFDAETKTWRGVDYED